MAFPTTAILDNFTRANETPIAAPWVSSVYWWGSGLDLVSNALANGDLVGPGFFGGGSYWGSAQFGPDFEAYFTISALPSPSLGAYFGLDLAVDDLAGPGPVTTADLIFTDAGSGNFTCALSYWLADTFDHDIVNFVVALVAGDQLGVRRVGNVWTVFKNGVAIQTAVDTALSGSSISIAPFINEGAGTQVTRIDAVGGGTLAGFTTWTRAYPTKASPEENVVSPSPHSWNSPFAWGERRQTYVLSSSKANGGVQQSVQYNTNQQGGWTVLHDRFMSRPLAAQVFGGTFDLCAYVQAVWVDPVVSPTNDSVVRFRLRVYLTVGQTAAERTLLLDYTDSVDWPGVGAAAWRSLSSAQAVATATGQDGDSLMVEFGAVVVSSPTPAYGYPPPIPPGQNYTSAPFAFLGTTNSSNVALTDATAGSGVLALSPWVEFSQAIVELPAGAAPANDACVDAVVVASLPYQSPRISTTYSAGTQKEVWYVHTFAAAGRVAIAAWGSNYLVQLDAGVGACGGGFSLPVERIERLVATTQSVGIWAVGAGETWRFRVRSKVPVSTDNGARESGGSLQIRLFMIEEPQADDVILPCGSLVVFREGQPIATTAVFFSAFPTGVAIDYTRRPMDDYDGGVNTNWRILMGLFGVDDVVVVDLPTLSVGVSYVDDIIVPLETPISPGVEVRKHPSRIAVSQAGQLYVGFFGNGFQFVDGYGSSIPAQFNTVPSNAALYGGIRVLSATAGDNQPGAPFTATVITGSAEVTNPWGIALQDPAGVIYYTSGGLYIPIGGTDVRRLAVGGTQLAPFATLTLPPATNPGVKGLYVFSNGSALVCNGTCVQAFTASGTLTGTFTPSVPALSRVLMDVQVTADGLSAWTVDLGTNTLWKFRLSDMTEIAYYETDLLPGALTQMAIVQPTLPPSPSSPGTGCPNTLTALPADGVGCRTSLGPSAV